MNTKTVYLKIAQITEVYEPNVVLKDIAEIYCKDPLIAAKMKTIKVIRFREIGKKQVESYVGSVTDLLKKMEQMESEVSIVNLGETDFVIQYRPGAGGNVPGQWMKTFGVALIAFFGAAFAIMTFNNDADVADVFHKVYFLVTGVEPNGITILEVSYSFGLALGILLFFNHFASWKITVDPTPIEVEMRLYEDNLNKTLIQNNGRKEKGIDVS